MLRERIIEEKYKLYQDRYPLPEQKIISPNKKEISVEILKERLSKFSFFRRRKEDKIESGNFFIEKIKITDMGTQKIGMRKSSRYKYFLFFENENGNEEKVECMDFSNYTEFREGEEAYLIYVEKREKLLCVFSLDCYQPVGIIERKIREKSYFPLNF